MSDTITLPRAVVQQALEALEAGAESWRLIGPAIEALRAALEQPEQEPGFWGRVAARQSDKIKQLETALAALEQPEPRNQCGETCERAKLCAVCAKGLEQPAQEPLSVEELDRLWREPMSADWEHREYARAVEAAHGIKEEK
jgi:hypothetical protein